LNNGYKSFGEYEKYLDKDTIGMWNNTVKFFDDKEYYNQSKEIEEIRDILSRNREDIEKLNNKELNELLEKIAIHVMEDTLADEN